MSFKSSLILSALTFVGVIGLSAGYTSSTKASTNQGNNPISKVATSGFDKKQVLEVNNQPFFYNGVQIRIDKLRDNYGYNMNDIRNAFKQAKSDGFTVVNSQILWSDVQPDKVLKPTDIAYIKNGDDAAKNFTESSTPLKLQNTDSSQSMVYLKYDLSGLDSSKFKAGSLDGVKLRIYAKSDSDSKLNIYGIDKDNSWSKDTTWKTAPYKGDSSKKTVSVSPTYDPIKQENYYDFDVTDFVNSQNAGKVTLALQSQKGSSIEIGGGSQIGNQKAANQPLNETPELSLSSKSNYDYNYLDQIIKAARDADIKLELLWFGSDTTKQVTEHRVPYHVMHDYTMAKDSKGKLIMKKSGPTSTTGQYTFNLDKNDANLQKQEAQSVSDLFNHVAENNKANGSTDTVIGAQMPNEPTTQMSYTEPSTALKSKMNMSSGDFNTWTLWNYTNSLDAAVKNSQYPVWTRVNNAVGDGGSGIIALNEDKRQSSSTNLDAVGLDPYTYDYQKLYDYGHSKPYADRNNIPMVMEDGMGSDSWSWADKNYGPLDAGLRTITALAGGATRNYYDFKSGDGFDLYDKVNADGTFTPHEHDGGKAIDSVRDVNHFVNKIGYDLATKQADGAGGKNMMFFNAVPASGNDFTATKKLNNTDVTYKTDTNKSMGIAIQRDDDDIVLASTLDSNATFTLKNFGKVTSVTYGQYESPQSDKWTQTNGNVTYKKNTDGTYTITVPKYSVVNVSKKTTTPSNNNNNNSNGSSSSNSSSTTPSKPNDNWKPSSPSKADGSTGLPNYAVKEGVVVYATKGLYMYKTANFKKSQRISKFAKATRVNRPAFVVIDYARSNSGSLRYKVRSLKNGKTGYITASRKYVVNAFYQTTPKSRRITVLSPKGINAYKSASLKTKVKHYKKGARLAVKRIVKHKLTTRYQLTNGHFVTAKKTLVIAKK